jgi:hypothetical protein
MMKKLIIEHGKEQYVEMSPDEEQQRLAEIAIAQQEEARRLEKEAQRQQALTRLRQASDTNIRDLLLILDQE